jgi:hypothetical protein
LSQYTAGMQNGQWDRSAGLEQQFLNSSLQNQQFDKNLGGQWTENQLGRGMGAFEADQGRRMQGVGSALGLMNNQSQNFMNAIQAGGIESNQQQRLIDSLYGEWDEYRNWDQKQNDQFGNALSRSIGGAGQQQTTEGPGPDRMSQGMGALALGNYFMRPGGGGK